MFIPNPYWQVYGARTEQFYWKTHPIVIFRILEYDTGRIAEKLFQKIAFSRKRLPETKTSEKILDEFAHKG